MNHLSAHLELGVRQVEGSIRQPLLAVWKSQAFKNIFFGFNVEYFHLQFDLSGSMCGPGTLTPDAVGKVCLMHRIRNEVRSLSLGRRRWTWSPGVWTWPQWSSTLRATGASTMLSETTAGNWTKLKLTWYFEMFHFRVSKKHSEGLCSYLIPASSV